jgi:hypothetical protein
MKKPSKLQILILLGIAAAATVILAAGLSNLKLLPGQPFSLPFLGERAPAEPGQYEPLPGGEFLLSLVRGLLILLVLLIPVTVVLAIIFPEFRKRILRRLISFVLLLVCLYALMRLRPDIFDIAEEIQIPEQAAQSEQMSPIPVTELISEPPQWLTPVASLCLALPFAALLTGLAVRLLSRRARRPAGPLEQLAQEAEEAIEQLRAGSDLKNTVIRCYAEMARVLAERRGIRRQQSMTTREFEEHLRGLNLPDEPIKRLTRLFEDVRYGTMPPGEREEQQAIASLTAIVEACQSSA